MWSHQYPSAQTQISNSVGSPSTTGRFVVAVNERIPEPDQTSEKPRASSTAPSRQPVPAPWTCPSQIAAGMVLAIEPGCYWEQGGGLRVEDNFLITSGGAEKLSAFPDGVVRA